MDTAKKLADALREIGEWDHRGDSVAEAYDEKHGFGAFMTLIEDATLLSTPVAADVQDDDLAHRIAYAIQQKYLHELAADSLEQIKSVVSEVIDEEDDMLTVAYLHGVSKSKKSAPEPGALTGAAERVRKFIESRKGMRGIDPNVIQISHDADGDAVELTVSDLAALAASQPVPAHPCKECDACIILSVDPFLKVSGTNESIDLLSQKLKASQPAPVDAQAVPEGWSIRRTPGKAEIGVTTPEGGPGGMFVSPSDRDLARRVLYALCEDLIAAAPTPSKGEA